MLLFIERDTEEGICFWNKGNAVHCLKNWEILKEWGSKLYMNNGFLIYITKYFSYFLIYYLIPSESFT
jgi:hypothetical protein